MLDGASRAEAAKVGASGPCSLNRITQSRSVCRSIPPGAPAKLNKEHRAFLARIADQGPIPAIHGGVRWRACDLIMRLHEEIGQPSALSAKSGIRGKVYVDISRAIFGVGE